MTRIYENRGLPRRLNISVAVTVFAILFGFWELWAAANAGPEGAGYGYLFGILFIGGGIFGMNQVRGEGADMVTALDVDESTGQAVVTVWRPLSPRTIATSLDRFSEWRPYSRMRRNMRTRMLLADHPGEPRPLQFEIGPEIRTEARFRALAPETFAADEE